MFQWIQRGGEEQRKCRHARASIAHLLLVRGNVINRTYQIITWSVFGCLLIILKDFFFMFWTGLNGFHFQAVFINII